MKKTLLLLAATFTLGFVSAQIDWNKKLPISSIAFIAATDQSRVTDGNYLITSNGQFIELDWQGAIKGYNNKTLGGITFSNYLQKRSDPASNSPYFLMGWRNYANPAYNLSYFKPELSSWQTLVTFGAGEIGNSLTRGPAVLELNDTSLLVISQSFARKVACPRDTLWLEWSKPIALEPLSFPSSAVAHGGNTIFVTSKGEVSAINSDGFQIWVKTYSTYVLRGIALVNDGIVACGATINGQAALIKMTFEGALIWEKTFMDYLELNALAITASGNIAATGKAADENIPLLNCDPNGNLLWKKSFQKGIGVTLNATPDAGYFLTGGGTLSGFCAIKTNAAGEASDVDNRELFQNRNLNNGGFSLTQHPSASLFNNFLGSSPGFQIPADSSTTTLFGHSPWLAGYDSGINLHTSADIFGDFFDSDYRMGISSSPSEDFNRLWHVTREQISQVRRDFGEDGVLDSPPPFDMLSWPAKGNPHFCLNLDFTRVKTNPDSFPAPFEDYNHDGIYNVYDGDYPLIKGDQMLWWAITDEATHQFSNGQPLGVDLLISVFAYDCQQNGSILGSVFAEYQIINRSGQDFADAYLGFYTDPDLGCDQDDNFGSLPEANSYYIYNQDAEDGGPGSSCNSGPASYGVNIPVQSITLLNQTLDHTMYYNRAGGGQGDPSTPQQFYNYLQSRWSDNTPLTTGGSGYNPGNPSSTPTNVVFPGNPSEPQSWSMCSESLPLADRRLISSHGPITFAAGDTVSMRLAFTFHPDIPHPCPNIDAFVKPTILQIRQWHDDGTLEEHLDLGSVLSLAPGQSLVLNATQQNPATAYAWSTGQNTPSIVVNQTGEYTVTVTPATGCAYSETVLVKSATGTSSPAPPVWKVQPNPASDVLSILHEKGEAPITAVLRNAQGQWVAATSNTGNAVKISVANLPPGLYWAELWQEGAFLGGQKVMVAR